MRLNRYLNKQHMEKVTKKHKLDLQTAFKNANIYLVKDTSTAVIEASGAYITMEEFKKVFSYMSDLIVEHGVKKLVFDKRELMVFHQPSMEWYFVEWKEKMFDHGLKTHRKILPQDLVFRESVKIGREKINKTYPHGKFHEMDIQYFETLEDAIEL